MGSDAAGGLEETPARPETVGECAEEAEHERRPQHQNDREPAELSNPARDPAAEANAKIVITADELLPAFARVPPLAAPASVRAPDAARGYGAAFAVLWLAAVLGSLAIVPYSWTLLKQANLPGVPREMLPLALGMQAVVEFALSAAAIAFGLWLGERVGLGVPRLRRWLAGDREAGRRIVRTLGLGAAMGFALGLPYLVLVRLGGAGAAGANLVMPPAWEGLLGALGAGVREEIWLRLGCMTLLAWAGAGLTRRRPIGEGVAWSANLLAALLFGAIHLPQAELLLGLTPGVLVAVLVGNGLPGLVFGWLYWRRDLCAAMMAHFCFDVVLKVIPPLLGMG